MTEFVDTSFRVIGVVFILGALLGWMIYLDDQPTGRWRQAIPALGVVAVMALLGAAWL